MTGVQTCALPICFPVTITIQDKANLVIKEIPFGTTTGSLIDKFPLLLAQGAEGIAVGLSTKILPHNFCELIEGSISILKEEPFQLLPDFPTGGMMDASNYQGGERGGKIRVRAKIEIQDKANLVIKEIPFGTTTGSLIDSIVKASEKGKIKIKRVTDNTAKNVEVHIELPPGARLS